MNSKLELVKSIVTRGAGRTGLLLQKNSPHIMFGVGVVGIIATTVVSSKATLKLEGVLEETETLKEHAKALHGNNDNYSDKDYQTDMVKLHARQIVKVGQLYLPAIGIGLVSVALITGSHVVLTRRNTAVMAAYAALDKGFRAYRARVVEQEGEDKDREYLHGVETKEIEVTTKKGVVKTVEKKVVAGTSIYDRFFEPSNACYNSASPEMNIGWLRMQMNYLNIQLQGKGHLFLNEVYDMLGMERSSAGAVVGWIRDNPDGDGYVDFGVWDDENTERLLNFVHNREDHLLLSFNVDGVIYDKI